jgi:dihydroorotate dehydrogenase electron transfer subunit
MSNQSTAFSSAYADQPDETNRGERAPWAATVVAEPAKVVSNDSVNAEYRHLVVSCGSVPAKAIPGQFFQLLCPQAEGDQPFLRRPMSLYGVDPLRKRVEFLYKVTGAGTRGAGDPASR